MPMIFTPRASNSALRSRNPQPSTVHPYVPAAGKNHRTVGLPAMLGGPRGLPSELVATKSTSAELTRGTSPLRSRFRISSTVVAASVGSLASATSEASLPSVASALSVESLASDASLVAEASVVSDESLASEVSDESVGSEVSVVLGSLLAAGVLDSAPLQAAVPHANAILNMSEDHFMG